MTATLPPPRVAPAAKAAKARIPVPPYHEVLPEGYWQDLVAPKVSPRAKKVRWGWVAGTLAFMCATGALAWVTARSTSLNQTGFALEPMGTPNPLPTPRVLEPTVRRAIGLPPAVRRAQLVNPPYGAAILAHMPYGETLRCTYLGDLPNQEALPLTNNRLGDMYGIGRYQFVWAAPAGGAAQWIDP